MRPTDKEFAELQTTIGKARGGRASLIELARAHQIADKSELPGCAAELRGHIRAVATDRHEKTSTARRDVFTGVVSGVLTHILLGGILK